MLSFQNTLLNSSYLLSTVEESWLCHLAVSLSQHTEDAAILFRWLSALSNFVLAGWIPEVCQMSLRAALIYGS